MPKDSGGYLLLAIVLAIIVGFMLGASIWVLFNG
jgi:hypothetical protein